jgi:hypothetical protein
MRPSATSWKQTRCISSALSSHSLCLVYPSCTSHPFGKRQAYHADVQSVPDGECRYALFLSCGSTAVCLHVLRMALSRSLPSVGMIRGGTGRARNSCRSTTSSTSPVRSARSQSCASITSTTGPSSTSPEHSSMPCSLRTRSHDKGKIENLLSTGHRWNSVAYPPMVNACSVDARTA